MDGFYVCAKSSTKFIYVPKTLCCKTFNKIVCNNHVQWIIACAVFVKTQWITGQYNIYVTYFYAVWFLFWFFFKITALYTLNVDVRIGII